LKHLPKISIFLILLVCGYFMKTARWDGYGGTNWKEQFSSDDSKGYYTYLPQFFIKHDLRNTNPALPYINKTKHGLANKYFIGTPIFWSPFFGAAYTYTKVKGETSDGYTEPFKKMISIAALFWLCIALFCLSETLRMLHFSNLVNAFTLVLITLGSNLFYYAVLEPTMSHLYSFTALSALICFGLKYFQTERKLFLVLSTLAFALGALLRPTNVIWMVCLLPFLAGGFPTLKEKILKRSVLLIAIPLLAVFIFIQCGVYYLATGHWFLKTYAGEGFYFFHPQFIKVLIGFQKGWFIYTPLAAIAMTGFIPLYPRNKTAFYSFLIALLLFIYTIAAWWSWSFADSFGHRAFIDLYPMVAILLAYALSFIPGMIAQKLKFLNETDSRFLFHSACCICLGINLIQTYQFYNHILHYNSMDWKRYQYVFLKTSPNYVNSLGGSVDIMPYSTKKPVRIYQSESMFSSAHPDWTTLPLNSFNGKPALHFKGEEYGATVVVPTSVRVDSCQKMFARISITRYEGERNSSSGVLLVANIQNSKNEHEYYNSFPINDEPADREGDLSTFHYTVEIPGLKDKNAKLAFYIWNQQKQDFYLCDFNVEIEQIFP
jgi:hypothetical protein